MSSKMSSQKNFREFLGGIQINIQADGLKLNLYGEKTKMTRNKVQVPRFYFDIDKFRVSANFQDNKDLKVLRLNLEVSLR